MNYNDILTYSILGDAGYRRYQTIKAIQKEHDRLERKARWNYIASVLQQSIKPTVDYIDDWLNVESERPNIERCFITGEYAIDVGEIVCKEHNKLNETLKQQTADFISAVQNVLL